VALAQALGGEVVSADSMQLYRGLDIGTAKPTVGQRQGVPHHLLDVWDVRQPASVADYQLRARAVVDRLLAEDRTPVLVGGSGLYVRAVLDDLHFPGTDANLRRRLETELETVGAAGLHARLAELDPAAAAAILASNGRRVVRALEVVELTGQPFTAALPSYSAVYRCALVGLDLPVDVLDRRIEQRVDAMWEAGFVDEVRGLAEQGLRDGVTACRALGYAQVLRHVDGDYDESTARAETVRATRRFARRQRSWFRRDPRVTWLPADGRELEGALAAVRSAGA
jgi:tRNA dimethylallyltransferase